MTHYAKFWDSIFGSSLMQEDIPTRYTHFCMALAADKHGEVYGIPAALARQFNIPPDVFEHALERLTLPDPLSTSPDEGGRRIVAMPGNRWRIVNFAKYRQMRCAEDRRDYWREYKRKKKKGVVPDSTISTPFHTVPPISTEVVGSKKEVEGRKKDRDGADAPGCSFEDFYRSYPKHDARQDAEKVWKRLSQEERFECLEKTPAWVEARAGTERRYIPKPERYLNGRLWRDELQNPNEKVGSPGGEVDVWCAGCGTQQRQTGSKYCGHCTDAMAAHLCPKCAGANPCGLTECQRCFEQAHPEADPVHVAEIFAPSGVPS